MSKQETGYDYHRYRKLLAEAVDDAKRLEKQVDDAMNKTRLDVDAAAKAKEQEIMTV